MVEITQIAIHFFKVDEITILNGTFGYDKDGNKIDDTEAITFDAKVDNEKIVETGERDGQRIQ